jgi:predicted metal-dependent phosphoesterase TrpH
LTAGPSATILRGPLSPAEGRLTYPPEVRRFDLHLHSSRSDGHYPPEEVLARCARGGLDVVALTDHDLSTPVPVGPLQIGGRTLHVLGGAELSGVHEGRELHLLVYFPGEIPEGFRDFCRQRAAARAVRYEEAVRRLDLPGLTGPDDDAVAGERSLTRHHLARALVAAGHAQDLRDAFRRFTAARGGHVPQFDLAFTEAIRVARAHGGLTSWAHPPLKLVESALPALVAAGLQALEGIRPGISGEERRKLRQHARKYGLLVTGGSDWHGWSDGDPGTFFVDRADLRELFAALDPIASAVRGPMETAALDPITSAVRGPNESAVRGPTESAVRGTDA